MLSGGVDWEQAAIALGVAVEREYHPLLGPPNVVPENGAMFFHDSSRGRPPGTFIEVDGTRVKVGDHIKYLGLHIDETWNFDEHFARMAPRLEAKSSSLSRLLPNI